MAWEIHTIGGSEYLFNIFNGVAALVNGSGYLYVIKMTALVAAMWVLFESAFKNQFMGNITWFIGFVLAYNLLFLPKADVIIHDELNRNSPYKSVQNVPFALAAFASMTSTVGNELTKMFEVAFLSSNNLTYHEHGMLFGSRLIEEASAIKITDSQFAQNINSFVQQCVFYDILLNKYTFNDLKKQEDIWQFVATNTAKSRSFMYKDNKMSKIYTCIEGAQKLTPLWDKQFNQAATILGLKLFPSLSKEAAKNALIAKLPVAYNNLIGISRSAMALLQQNMMANAIKNSSTDFAGNYLSMRADIQTRTAYRASKAQAAHWVPILRIMFEVLFYGAFPLVFLLMLLPFGGQVARGYFGAFIWLQSWGPLYAILNMVMEVDTKYRSTAAATLADGGKGLTFITKAGIEAINQDVSLAAGNWAWMIPFLSTMLIYGVKSVSNLATAALAAPQAATNAAANEIATGNISLANSSLGNSSFNNVSGNKWNDSMFHDGGRMQAVNSMGGMSSYTSGGNEIHDMSSTVSKLPNMQVTKNQSEGLHLTQAAMQAVNTGNSLSSTAESFRSQGFERMAQHLSSHNIGESHGIRYNQHASTEQRDAMSHLNTVAEELSRSKQIDKATAFNMALNGNVSANVEATVGNKGGKGGVGVGANANFGAMASADTRSTMGYQDSERTTNLKQLDHARSVVLSGLKDKSIELVDSNGNSLNESINQSFASAERLEEQSRAYYDIGKSISSQAQYVSSSSTSVNQEVTPELINYVAHQKGLNGQPLGQMKAMKLLQEPEFLNNAVTHYQVGNDQYQNKFNTQQAHLGTSNLKSDYQEISKDIHDRASVSYNSNVANDSFDKAIRGQTLNNKAITTQVDHSLSESNLQMQNTKLDKAEVGQEIRNKLKDDAFVTRMKAIGQGAKDIINGEEKPKSNFDENN